MPLPAHLTELEHAAAAILGPHGFELFRRDVNPVMWHFALTVVIEEQQFLHDVVSGPNAFRYFSEQLPSDEPLIIE